MDRIIPKKNLGQHWLHDDNVLESICDSADVCAGDTVLEIGPGLGTLTARLLARGARVVAVEFDKALATQLTANISQLLQVQPVEIVSDERLTVVESDILRFDLRQLPKDFKVVANIPYYLTSNLIRVLCESKNSFDQAAILIQKEVAERVCAEPGNMSILSVSAQYYCEARLGIFVPKQFFTPPPKVDSQVLELTFRRQALFPDVDTEEFFRVVKAGFSQKRKTLLNSLSAGLHLSKDATRVWLESSGVQPSSRAQTLSLEDWHRLYLAR